jgi:hypothetical protein
VHIGVSDINSVRDRMQVGYGGPRVQTGMNADENGNCQEEDALHRYSRSVEGAM